MTWAPTTGQLLDLDGVNVRADRFEFELLDLDLQPIGLLAPDADRPPIVANDANQGKGRTVSSLNLPVDEVNDINPVSDRLRPWMVLQNGARFELGLFIWGVDNRPRRPWGVEHATSLVDQTLIIDQPMYRSIGQNKGANITVIAVALAQEVIPRERIVFPASSQGLAAPIAWPPNTNRLTAINDLMAMLGFVPAYFDRRGWLIFRDAPDMANVTVDHAYELGGRIYANSDVESDDLLDAHNRYAAYESSGQGPSLFGRYDVPDSAPHSIANRGFAVSKVESVQGLQTSAQARKAAQTMALTDEDAFLWQRFTSTADPRHDTWDVVQFLGGIYLEAGWALTCRSGGPMTHTIRRVY